MEELIWYSLNDKYLRCHNISLFQALLWQCRRGRLAGSGRKKGEVPPSPFFSRIPLAADPACRPLAFSITLTDREPGTGYHNIRILISDNQLSYHLMFYTLGETSFPIFDGSPRHPSAGANHLNFSQLAAGSHLLLADELRDFEAFAVCQRGPCYSSSIVNNFRAKSRGISSDT